MRVTGFFLLFCFCSLVFSCGIAESYYLEPPLEGTPATGLSGNDFLTNKYNFTIPNIDNNSMLLGYVVYYKIYNSSAAVTAADATIKNSNKLYSDQGMNTLKTLGYREMQFLLSDGTSIETILKGPANSLEKIEIRLIDESGYSAGYSRGTTPDGEPLLAGMPRRFNGNSFQLLKADGALSENFQTSDMDVNYSTTNGTDTWYVNAYAAAFGMTPQFSSVYSQLLPLGVVRIVKPETNF